MLLNWDNVIYAEAVDDFTLVRTILSDAVKGQIAVREPLDKLFVKPVRTIDEAKQQYEATRG